MVKLLAIAAGGAIGATMRYLGSGWIQRLTTSQLPWGTLVVNVLGCCIVGFLGAFFAGPHLVREEYRVAILVGVLGAFTTFSTFGWETLTLATGGQLRLAAANVVASNLFGLVAVWLGYRLGLRLFGT